MRRKVFGLLISDKIAWAVCEAEQGYIIEKSIVFGCFDDIVEQRLPQDRSPIEIEHAIRTSLVNLRSRKPALFKDVNAIGVSTMGVVDRQNLAIDNLVRRKWSKHGNEKHLISFESLLLQPTARGEMLFEGVRKEDIRVQNDTTAMCLTERRYGQTDTSQNLLYVLVTEGINAAYAYGKDVLSMTRHSEMGHMPVWRHEDDLGFDPDVHSGCSAHFICLEGLASDGRFLRQYERTLGQLPSDHPAWRWEAYYLAQLAMVGALTFNPDKIVFGGPMFAGKKGEALIEGIRWAFVQINRGYLPDYEKKGQVDKLIEKARVSADGMVLSALTIGCLAAFPADDQKPVDIWGRPPSREEFN